MPTDVLAAARKVLAGVTSDPRYAHTSHLQVVVRGSVVVDEHLRGPLVSDVFSVTKSVPATVLGVVAARVALSRSWTVRSAAYCRLCEGNRTPGAATNFPRYDSRASTAAGE